MTGQEKSRNQVMELPLTQRVIPTKNFLLTKETEEKEHNLEKIIQRKLLEKL